MLFQFPVEIPFLGQYFNLLPFLVVALMLVQTKLFAPPATTPEAEQQQKMMKYMMIFMAVMFYKVPSGLGLYFITSSLWSIGERLLLPASRGPSSAAQPEPPAASSDGGSRPAPRPKAPPDGNGAASGGGWRDRLRERLERVMDDANHDKTVRNTGRGRPPERRRPSRGGNPPGKRRP